MRIVGSLTTIPGRYPKLLRTLDSLLLQDFKLDTIYLCIPKKSKRLNKYYDKLDENITNKCEIVEIETDYGPCTKLIGGLLMEHDPETIIITFDDDVIYDSKLVRSLVNYSILYPEDAIGSTGILFGNPFPFYSSISNSNIKWNLINGINLNNDGKFVDVLCGFSGVLYKRKFFPSSITNFLSYPLMDDNVYINDDIYISGYIDKFGVKRRVVKDIPQPNSKKLKDKQIDIHDGNEISYDKLKFLSRFEKAKKMMISWGFFQNPEPLPYDQTIVGVISILFIFCLLILFGFFLSLFYQIPSLYF